MKKLLGLIILLQCFCTTFGANVVVHKSWVEYGVVSNNEEGVYLHTKFSVNGMNGKTIRVIFYFYNQRKEKLLGGIDGYRTTDYQVSKSETSKSTYDNAIYKDFKIFIPYKALPLKRGLNSWFIRVRVYDEYAQKFIDNNSNYIAFKKTVTNDNINNQSAQNLTASSNSTVSTARRTTQTSSSNSKVPPFIECAYCNGTGKYMCTYCGGNGWRMENTFIMYQGYVMYKVTCSVCSGTGKSNYCMYCNGTGKRPNPDYISSGAGSSVTPSGSYSSGSSTSSSTPSGLCKYCGGGGGCSSCKGTGHKYNSYSMSEDTCPSCKGSGRCFNCRGTGRQR